MIRVFDFEVTPVVEITVDALMEFHRYGVQGRCQSVHFLNTPLEFHNGYWVLETPFVVGQGRLEVCDLNGTVHVVTCTIHPDSTKVSHRRYWNQMLRDLYKWWGPYPGRQLVRDGTVVIGQYTSILLLEALCHEFTLWGQMLIDVIQPWLGQYHPHIRSKNRMALSDSDLGNVQHSAQFQKMLSSKCLPEQVQVRSRRANVFHPVGQYIQYLLQRVYEVILELEQRLVAMEHTHPVRDMLDVLCCLQQQLDFGNHTASISSTPKPSEQIMDCPIAVRDFISQGELFLKHQMDLGESGRIMQPYSYQVYELWCFYRLIELCTEGFQTQPTVTHMGNESGWGMCVQFELPDDVIELLYNPRFESYWTRGGSTHYSLVGEQRPDIVIRSSTQWCVLDAKYRSGLTNVLDSFSTAFSYLESLTDLKRGGSPTHSILLMPQPDAETTLWFDADFIHENHFGCLHFNPVVFVFLLPNKIHSTFHHVLKCGWTEL